LVGFQGVARAPEAEEAQRIRVALEDKEVQVGILLSRLADTDQLVASLRAAVAARDDELYDKELQLQAYENSLEHSLGLTVRSCQQPYNMAGRSGIEEHPMLLCTAEVRVFPSRARKALVSCVRRMG
jgi:hypothetical protein